MYGFTTLTKLQVACLKSRPILREKLQTVQLLNNLCKAISVTVHNFT